MRKKILVMVFILSPLAIFGQNITRTDYNFGFEKISFSNNLSLDWIKWGTDNYSIKTDVVEKHSGLYSISIESTRNLHDQSFGCAAYAIPANFKGSKIEVRAFMKMQNVENGHIGLLLRIDLSSGKSRFENMQQKDIHGTSDWKLYSVKLPLSKDATTIYIGALLAGTGKLWADDFQILIDGQDISKAEQKIQEKPFNRFSEQGNDSITSSDSLNTSEATELFYYEKVYVQTDRDNYYPGDNIWFKAYLIDGFERLLSDQSNNLHVELISPSSEIVDSRVVRMNEGLGNGDFKLPDKIKSGKYILRAYTNYMRNFGDEPFFSKDFRVINTEDALKVFPSRNDILRNKPEISFFPEGGSLVDSIPSIVAFKAVNSDGTGCYVEGEVYSSSGEIVTKFISTHLGLGAFVIYPIRGISYYAIARNEAGDSVIKVIPMRFSTGIVMYVSRNQDNNIEVILKTNAETLPEIVDKEFIFTVSGPNGIICTYNIRIKTLINILILPVDNLDDGVLKLTLSGTDERPLCERLVYVQGPGDDRLIIKTDKTIYKQRDSVSVKISLSENSDTDQEAFLSLSVTKNMSAESISRFPTTISSWFLLESDVKGTVEEPSYYFDPSNPDRLKHLDLLLLTQGWRDFKWKYKSMNYPPESGFNISGRVRKLFTEAPIPKSKVNIALFKRGNPLITTIPTDSSGKFKLDGIDLTGESKLIISSGSNNSKLKGWVILDSLKYSPAQVNNDSGLAGLKPDEKKPAINNKTVAIDHTIESDVRGFIQYANIKNSIQKKYRLSDTINPGEVTITVKRQDMPESARSRSERYLMTLDPDYEFVITPQSEIFNNLGRLISFRLHMGSGNMGGLSYNNPLVLLDGMNVGWEGISYLPVEWIERVDGLRPGSPKALIWGERGKGGVISIITRTGVPVTDKIKVFHSVNVLFHGYNEPRVFYSPVHHSTLESDYKPDLRTTLYWEPNIIMETGKDLFVNYFNADNPSKVTIVVEGITSTGIPVTGKTEYEVK